MVACTSFHVSKVFFSARCDLSSVPLSLVELSSRFANYSLTFLLKFLGLL